MITITARAIQTRGWFKGAHTKVAVKVEVTKVADQAAISLVATDQAATRTGNHAQEELAAVNKVATPETAKSANVKLYSNPLQLQICRRI